MNRNEKTSAVQDEGLKSRLRPKKKKLPSPVPSPVRARRFRLRVKTEISYFDAKDNQACSESSTDQVESSSDEENGKVPPEGDLDYEGVNNENNQLESDSNGDKKSRPSIKRTKPKNKQRQQSEEKTKEDQSSSDEGSYSKIRKNNIASRMELMKKLGIFPDSTPLIRNNKPTSSTPAARRGRGRQLKGRRAGQENLQEVTAENGAVKDELVGSMSIEERFERGALQDAHKDDLFKWIRSHGVFVRNSTKKIHLVKLVEKQINKEKLKGDLNPPKEEFPDMPVEERFAKGLLESTPRRVLNKWLKSQGVVTNWRWTMADLFDRAKEILNQEKEIPAQQTTNS